MNIPEEFWNTETGGLLDKCLVCGVNVIEYGEPYLLEKIQRNVHTLNVTEVLFEYALCGACAQDLQSQMSEKSKKTMQEYIASHGHPAMKQLPESEEDLDLKHCSISGNELAKANEYAMHALCIARELHPMMAPYALCDKIMDGLAERLSSETVDMLEDFKGKHFNGPPEYADILNPGRLISI